MSYPDDEPDTVEVEGEVKHVTDAAYLFNDGSTKCWLPKSQCDWELGDNTGHGTMTVPVWLAEDRGLV